MILASWGIAFVEYCFQVPVNRIGHYQFNAAQLKTIQEVITLVVFCAFSVWYLKEPLKWNYLVGFALMAGGVFVIFNPHYSCRFVANACRRDARRALGAVKP